MRKYYEPLSSCHFSLGFARIRAAGARALATLNVTASGDRWLGHGYTEPYTSTSEDAIQLLDISDPARPKSQGTYWSSYDVINSFALAGDFGYCGSDNIIKILDLAQNTTNTLATLGTITLSTGNVTALASYAGLLFANGGNVLYVIDANDPLLPKTVGSITLPGSPVSIAVAGRQVYAAMGERGLAYLYYTGSYPLQVTNISRGLTQGRLHAGRPVFSDRTFTFAGYIPPALEGQPYIQTLNNEKNVATNPYLAFSIDRKCRVYVAMADRTGPLPAWLAGWSRANMRLQTTDPNPGRVLFFHDFPTGRVSLGPIAMPRCPSPIPATIP